MLRKVQLSVASSVPASGAEDACCHEPRGYIEVDSFKIVIAASMEINRCFTSSLVYDERKYAGNVALLTIPHARVQNKPDSGFHNLEIRHGKGGRRALCRLHRFGKALQ